MNTFYKYNAKVLRVVDGDTIDAQVELGFKVSMKIRFRLEGYDSPETWRPKDMEEREAGQKATAYLEGLIAGKEVIIESSKFGKYRYLGTVFQKDSNLSVNQLMIDAGHIK